MTSTVRCIKEVRQDLLRNSHL